MESQNLETLKVKITNGILPTKATDEAAGWDLHSTEDVVIPSHSRQLVNTGLCFTTPPNTYGRIAPRSGLAVKEIDVAAGVIDRDYTGELKVILVNHGNSNFTVTKKDRIAQLIIERIAPTKLVIAQKLEVSSRGGKGFGSSGT